MISSRLLVLPLALTLSLAAHPLPAQDAHAQADSGTPAQITYERSWPQQKIPFFRITVRSDGSGVYTTDPMPGASTTADSPATDPANPQATQPIHISARNRAEIFATASAIRSGHCASSNTHTANTGQKTLTLESAGAAPIRCTFNFSDDKHIEEAVATLNAIALTLEEGTRLSYLARFDHLGLDSALGSLLDDARANRALDIENLAPILHRLQTNDTYMARVRDRATQLLALAEK